ncbi:hypothetical protein VP1G_10488 [Cytospora mali]|uniref:Uncharacterized protein n=1 Tax=Cytospora mali TaxID=578113 RepID=A0A194ULV9_CYTMA|nr:hypothetical protein VP1G_10488 [Valsa mali var. pyri (nom. inval.)]
MAADCGSLHLLQLLLECLDLGMRLLQVLVKTVTLGNELLLPLSEPLLLDLDLLGEPLSEGLLLLLELGVIQLPWTSLAELAGLHLLSAVGLVVKLLGGVDQVEHVGTDENGSELLEIAVILVLDLSNTPRVLTSLHNAAVAGLDVLLGSDDSERHSSHQATRVLSGSLVVLLDRGLSVLLTRASDWVTTYALLELCKVSRAESISLGDDRYQVDARAEALHDLDVERLEGVAGWANEVQASVNTQVDLVISAGLLLLQHVGLVLVVEELDDGHPRVPVVDIVAKSRELLLQLSLCNLDLDSLVDLLLMSPLVVGIVLDGCGEESVDEGSLAETRLAGYHNGEGGASLRDDLVALVWQIGDANWARTAFGRHVDGLKILADEG